MKLDMMLYGIEDGETVEIEGKVYELYATGNGVDYYGLSLVKDGDVFKLICEEEEPALVLCEADSLTGIFEKVYEEDGNELQIIWDERRAEADQLIDEYSDAQTTDDCYAEAIQDLEDDGNDVTEMRKEFAEVFGYEIEEVL